MLPWHNFWVIHRPIYTLYSFMIKLFLNIMNVGKAGALCHTQFGMNQWCTISNSASHHFAFFFCLFELFRCFYSCLNKNISYINLMQKRQHHLHPGNDRVLWNTGFSQKTESHFMPVVSNLMKLGFSSPVLFHRTANRPEIPVQFLRYEDMNALYWAS